MIQLFSFKKDFPSEGRKNYRCFQNKKAKSSNLIPISSQSFFTNTSIVALIKANFLMSYNTLILYQYLRKRENAKKAIIGRPVSIPLNLSKIYKILTYNQLCDYFDTILFPSQCSFRKRFSTKIFLSE